MFRVQKKASWSVEGGAESVPLLRLKLGSNCYWPIYQVKSWHISVPDQLGTIIYYNRIYYSPVYLGIKIDYLFNNIHFEGKCKYGNTFT